MEEVVKRTYAWNKRKAQFSPRQIKLAMNVLSEKNWLIDSLWARKFTADCAARELVDKPKLRLR